MRRILLLLSMVWLLSPVIHASYNASDGVFYLKNTDGKEEFTVDGGLTFRTDPSQTYSYRDGGVIFYPQNEGDIIIATIESVAFPDGAALFIYDDNIDAIKDKLAKSGNGGTYSYFPAGYCQLITNATTDYPTVYQSQDAGGAMAFGLHTGSGTNFSANNQGFVINITSGVPKDMEYKSAAFTPTRTLTRGEKSAVLGTLNVVAEGVNSPLALSAISADVSALEAKGVTNIMLLTLDSSAPSSLLAMSMGGSLSYTGEVTLKSGNNTYFLAGSLPNDFVGEIPAPVDIKVTVAGDQKSVTADGSTTVENTILMPKENTVFTISDAANFYDDGGKDGKIGEKFTGSVTFVPAREGQKIRIDFDKLAIFYNSSAVSVGNQDVFKFYSGRTADEANLITTITDKAKIVKSTADDGSLTVTLASKTGVPADGWEAVVSQFIPGDMTISSAEATYPDAKTASAYDQNVRVANFNVRANNTLNPISLASVEVDVKGVKDLIGLAVYALGEENDAAKITASNKVGGLTPSADGTALITLTGAELIEGSNWYAITADIATSALNGDKFSIAPKSVKYGDSSTTIASSETSEMEVANVFSHHVGTDLREIHDTWKFVSTPDPISHSKALLSTEDCIVTFVPDEGSLAELEFSKFDLSYPNYGTKAKFEVYSGRETNAANLLWDLHEYQGKPDGKLRSVAEDGSITILFNNNTTSSYYGSNGWESTVRPFRNHNMTVGDIAVQQTNTSVIMPGARDEEILNLTIETEGTLDSRKLTAVKVDLKNSLASVTKVSVKAANADGEMESVGSADVADNTEITVPCGYTLSEGKNVFVIAYDIDPDVEADAVLDGKILSVTTDAGTVEVANGDPAGERVAKYIYLMSAGNHTVSVGKAIHFYDDGGADGKLTTAGLNGTVTFVPQDPAMKVRATVVSYSTAANTILDFYSGREVNDANSLGQCKSSTKPELPMVSKADDGAMFVNVASASTYSAYAGWDIIVEQYTPAALHATGVEAKDIADEQVVRGITDAPMAEIDVKVDGDNQNISLTKLTASLTADQISDVKEVKLWYTAKYDGFNPNRLLATAVPQADGSIVLNVDQKESISEFGTFYYWLTASLSTEADAGNNIKFDIKNATFSDGTALTATGVAAQTSVKCGFAGGEYVIGASDDADYASFEAAISAMGGAIEGPVKFLVEPGTYEEDVYITDIKGTSHTNTITFTSQSGNAEDVTVAGAGYVNGGYSAPKYGVINVENTDWVILDNLTIKGKETANTEYPYYVHYVQASRHNTLSNCVLPAATPAGSTGLYTVYATWKKNSSDPEANGNNPDFLTIKNNTFTGGYIAIDIQGSNGYVKYEPLYGLTITGNTFTDCGSKCIYPYQVNGLTISGNTMAAGTAVTKSNYYAIDMVRCTGDVDVFNNRIVNNQTVYSSGIYVRDNTKGTAERPIRIYNNSISVTASPNLSGACATISTECEYIDFVHNSLNMEGQAGYGVNINNSKTTFKGLRFMNNAVRTAVTNSNSSYAFNITQSLSSLMKDFTFATNAMHSGSSPISNVAADLEAWKTLTGDETLLYEEPKFASATDHHLAEQGNLIAATPVEYADTDLEGVKRAAVPTIGAFEFVKLSEDAPRIAKGYPKADNITHTSARVTSNWDMAGKLYAKTVKSDADAPSADDMLTGEPVDVLADTDTYIEVADLEGQTAYKIYLILVGNNGKSSDVASVEFTTLRYIAPLTVTLDLEQPDADTDSHVEITPVVEGGDAPYTYVWTNQHADKVGDEKTLAIEPTHPDIFTLTVTSADGQTASAYTSLKVYGYEMNADFSDLYLDEESYWWGTQDSRNTTFHFFSGSFMFPNYCNTRYRAWEGFAYANLTANSFVNLSPDQFNNAAGGGANESPNYAVIYAYGNVGKDIEVLKSRDGAMLDHVFVNNTAYTVNSILNGDSFADPFAEGDYHKIVFTGDDPEGTPVECFLVDYRDGKRELTTDWKRVDLKPLGSHVKKLNVKIQSSNTSVPAYAALDNLAYNGVITGVDRFDEDGINASDIKAIRVTTMEGMVVFASEEAGEALTGLEQLASGIYIVEYELLDGSRLTRKIRK